MPRATRRISIKDLEESNREMSAALDRLSEFFERPTLMWDRGKGETASSAIVDFAISEINRNRDYMKVLAQRARPDASAQAIERIGCQIAGKLDEIRAQIHEIAKNHSSF